MPQQDIYPGPTHSQVGPYIGAFAVVASTEPLTYVTRAVYIATAGNLTGITRRGETVTFNALPVGTILPVRFTHITAAPANTIALY